MKICLINNLYYPDTKGGVETIVKTIALELQKQKHEVFIICADKEYKKIIEEKIDNLSVYRIGYEKYFPFHNIDKEGFLSRFLWRINQLNNKFSSLSVYQILSKEKPDLILSHNVLALGYNVIKTIETFCSISKSKHIATIHDVQLLYPSGVLNENNKKRGLLLKIYAYITRNIYKSCKYIISPSETLLSFYLKYNFFSKAKVNVIQNPISLDIDNNSIKNIPHDKDVLNILFFGQIEEHKGVFDIVKAIRSLDIEKFKLTIAGHGSQENRLKSNIYVVNNIEFVGSYDKIFLKELLQKNDISIVASKCFENSPMVIYEAWENRTPVLAAKIGGIPELIEEGKTGWLFKSGDIEDLKNKLKQIYNEREKMREMSEYCIEKVKNFDTKKYIEKILSI